MKYMPSQVLDLDFLVLDLALGTVKVDRELGFAVILDLPTAFFASTTKQKFSTPVLSESASSSNSSVYRDFATFWPFSLTLVVIFPVSALLRQLYVPSSWA